VPSWWHGQSVAIPLRLSGDADTRARYARVGDRLGGSPALAGFSCTL
jgi:hypothetical protein